jgi:hypothetical protein
MNRTWRNADSLSQYNRIQPKNEYFWQNIEQSYTTISGRKNVDEVAEGVGLITFTKKSIGWWLIRIFFRWW